MRSAESREVVLAFLFANFLVGIGLGLLMFSLGDYVGVAIAACMTVASAWLLASLSGRR